MSAALQSDVASDTGAARPGARLTLAVWAVLGAGGAAYLFAFGAAAVARLVYPYPLNRIEEPSLQAVLRILHGQSLYVAPTLDYVPQLYPPLYFYLAALASLALGPSLLALRLVSLLASIGSLLLVYRLVVRETRLRAAGLLAAGLLAATFPLGDLTLDLARVDPLFLFLLLAGLYAARAGAAGVSGALLALAILTKQTGLLPAASVLVFFAATSRRRLLACGLGVLVVLGAGLLLLTLQSGPWALTYLWDWPRRHPLSPDLLPGFWTDDLLRWLAIATLLGPVYLIACLLRGERRAALFYGLTAAGLLLAAWTGYANPGASGNVLLPAFAALAILFGLSVHEAARLLGGGSAERRVFHIYLLGLAGLQAILLLYNPRLVVPYRSDGWASDRLTARLAALPGPLFAPDFGAYSRLAGQGEQPHITSVEEMVGMYSGRPQPQAAAWTAELAEALRARRYGSVLLEQQTEAFFLRGLLAENGYVSAGPLFPPDDQFWLWRGHWTPAAELYVPAS